jgi:hypothetical protein
MKVHPDPSPAALDEVNSNQVAPTASGGARMARRDSADSAFAVANDDLAVVHVTEVSRVESATGVAQPTKGPQRKRPEGCFAFLDRFWTRFVRNLNLRVTSDSFSQFLAMSDKDNYIESSQRERILSSVDFRVRQKFMTVAFRSPVAEALFCRWLVLSGGLKFSLLVASAFQVLFAAVIVLFVIYFAQGQVSSVESCIARFVVCIEAILVSLYFRAAVRRWSITASSSNASFAKFERALALLCAHNLAAMFAALAPVALRVEPLFIFASSPLFAVPIVAFLRMRTLTAICGVFIPLLAHLIAAFALAVLSLRSAAPRDVSLAVANPLALALCIAALFASVHLRQRLLRDTFRRIYFFHVQRLRAKELLRATLPSHIADKLLTEDARVLSQALPFASVLFLSACLQSVSHPPPPSEVDCVESLEALLASDEFVDVLSKIENLISDLVACFPSLVKVPSDLPWSNLFLDPIERTDFLRCRRRPPPARKLFRCGSPATPRVCGAG